MTGRRHPVFGTPGPAARAALAHPDVALVAGLLPARGTTYVPDFLTPQPGDRCSDLFDEQLAAIEATSQDDLQHQIGTGIQENWGRPASVAVHRVASSGRLQRRLAAGPARFWRDGLADLWPTVRSVIDQDIATSGTNVAAHGLGRVSTPLIPGSGGWATPSSSTRAGSAKMDLTGRDLVLATGVLTGSEPLVQDPHDAVLHLPARRIGTGTPRTGTDLGAVLGDARALLLGELEQARSTTDLARKLGYAPGTISYHLRAMHRIGLVTKSRAGRFVLYQRTRQAHALLPDQPHAR